VGSLRQRLGVPVSGASVAIVRIGLGLLIAIESVNYLTSDWIRVSYLDPGFLFTYEGFGWVQPWPGPGLYIHFAVLAVLGVALAVGIAHRLVAPLLAAGFLYVFLLDKAEYLNHFYAAILLLVLLALIPADRAISLAARRHPERPRTVPLWSVWILRFQVGVVYVYAGIAKLGSDWVAGEPMGSWLAERGDLVLVGPLLEGAAAGQIFSLAGLAFDLLIVPLLLWRRTRALAFVAAVGFHLSNWVIFDIGIFPPMMIVATTVFFDPDWPLKLRAGRVRDAATAAGAAVGSRPIARSLTAVLAVFVAVQILFPLRHHLQAGAVQWTEEGHRFSWRMKLRQKDGIASFYAVDPATGERRPLSLDGVITPRQHLRASTRPDMLAQLAAHLAERERARGQPVEIRVQAPVSLNGRPAAPLVDPGVDLATVSISGFRSADWIEPAPDSGPERVARAGSAG
jgi:hypothetical protein